MAQVSEVARQLKAIRGEAGMTVQAVADAIGVHKSTYASNEDKFKKPFLPVDLVRKLVPIFKENGIDEARIWALAGVSHAQPKADIDKNANTDELVATRNSRGLEFLPGRSTLVRDLPILGHAKAGNEGFFIDQGQPQGYAMRPESLRGVIEAYAIRCHDDCMVPRFEPGNIVQVDPFREPKPGDNVIIQLKDGQALLKVLVRRAAGAVTCRQFNPDKTINFKKDEVRSVHLVVGVDFLER